MIYNYPFFSFPHFRKYPNYYPTSSSYIRQPIPRENILERTTVNNKASKLNQSIHSSHNQDLYLEKSASKQTANSVSNFEEKKERSSFKRKPSGFSFLNNILHQEDRSEDENFFDLLGIKLYNDDLLLIGLIFFLYKEDVKDQYLFFALILLLLS